MARTQPTSDTPAVDTEPAPAVDTEPAPAGSYPTGLLVGAGVTECVVGDLGTFAVDPDTGRITGPA